MNRYRIAVFGCKGQGVTSSYLICDGSFEAETEADARAMAEHLADEAHPEYAPFAMVPRLV